MFKIVDRTTLANRMAAYERRDMWKTKAGLTCVPLMFVTAMAFDPGALGQILRAACAMLVA